jgi:hypothetical protein
MLPIGRLVDPATHALVGAVSLADVARASTDRLRS